MQDRKLDSREDPQYTWKPDSKEDPHPTCNPDLGMISGMISETIPGTMTGNRNPLALDAEPQDIGWTSAGGFRILLSRE